MPLRGLDRAAVGERGQLNVGRRVPLGNGGSLPSEGRAVGEVVQFNGTGMWGTTRQERQRQRQSGVEPPHSIKRQRHRCGIWSAAARRRYAVARARPRRRWGERAVKRRMESAVGERGKFTFGRARRWGGGAV